jgi:hypothetical protein
MRDRELPMNPNEKEIPLTDEDRERVHIIRNAIAAGTYEIGAHDVAAQQIVSMLAFCDASPSYEASSSSENGVEDQRRNSPSTLHPPPSPVRL